MLFNWLLGRRRGYVGREKRSTASELRKGIKDAILALPMTLLAKALLIDHDPQMRWVNAFISNDPDTAIPREITVVAIDADGVVDEAELDDAEGVEGAEG